MKKILFYLFIFTAFLCTGCHHNPEPGNEMFCFTALEDNLQVSMSLADSNKAIRSPQVSLLYSLDGEHWQDFIVDKTVVTVPKAGNKVYIKASGVNNAFAIAPSDSTEGYSYNINSFKLSKKAKVSGNIMYLLNGTNPSQAVMGEAAFACLFMGDSLLMDASELILPAMRLSEACYLEMFERTSIMKAPALPATALADMCYCSMFLECKYLSSAPELPATSLEYACYKSMFSDCISLKAAPKLPSTCLTPECYNYMFSGCEMLTQAPALPATELKPWCYSFMFMNCKSLVNAPALPATTLEECCYRQMFTGCTSLTEAPALPAPILVKECYRAMFKNCTSLTRLTCMATDITATDCVRNWMHNITTSGTLTAAEGTDWTGLIPETWKVVRQ